MATMATAIKPHSDERTERGRGDKETAHGGGERENGQREEGERRR
jgi:hypothetical protein